MLLNCSDPAPLARRSGDAWAPLGHYRWGTSHAARPPLGRHLASRTCRWCAGSAPLARRSCVVRAPLQAPRKRRSAHVPQQDRDGYCNEGKSSNKAGAAMRGRCSNGGKGDPSPREERAPLQWAVPNAASTLRRGEQRPRLPKLAPPRCCNVPPSCTRPWPMGRRASRRRRCIGDTLRR